MDVHVAHPFSFVKGRIYLAYLQVLVLVKRLGTVHLA